MSATPFDPRRLADLANRVGPPAAYAAPRPVVAESAAGPGAESAAELGAESAAGPGAESAAEPGAVESGAAGTPTAAPDGSDGGTGHARVDAALGELARSASLAPHEQIAAYESVHRTLQETLRSVEQT
jgi:hypothetical protein